MVRSKLICFRGERAGPVDNKMRMMVAGIKCPLSNFTAISEQTHFVLLPRLIIYGDKNDRQEVGFGRQTPVYKVI